MKYVFALLAVIGSAAAQGVTAKIAPTGTAPATCEPTYAGNFEIAVVDVTGNTKRDATVQRRADSCTTDGILVASLADGVLTDSKGRTGYIASNYQFQFDGPPQAGAIYTAGFSVCGNSSLALGSSTVFYKCQSGSFYNLYDRSWAAQCSPVEIEVLSCDSSAAASQSPDGQVVGTEVVTTTIVKPLSDGQPQVITTTVPIPMCQISDGQVQAKTTPCASVTSVAPVSQYTDGQVQATSVVPVSQYSDGQIQVTGGSTSVASMTVPLTIGSGTVTVTMPTETLPSVTGTASAKTFTTPVVATFTTSALVNTTKSVSSAGFTTGTGETSVGVASSSPSPTFSAPPKSGAGHTAPGSLVALAVGVIAALFF